MNIDFFARWSHYIDHMAPIYKALGSEAGDFFIPPHLTKYAKEKYDINGVEVKGSFPYPIAMESNQPILVASHADLQTAYTANRSRPIILMEHGVGLVFPNNASYAGSTGYRRHASLTLAPNSIVQALTENALPGMKQAVIGTPKLDKWKTNIFYPGGRMSRRPVIAISFHWDGRIAAPEAGSAFEYFKGCLDALNNHSGVELIGHCHPRAVEHILPFYKKHRIQYESDFDEVMKRANIYINDSSSTLYEFLVTGKPVIIMNSPRFRKDVHHGIRFWDFTDIGPMVWNCEQLFLAIEETLSHPNAFAEARKRTVDALYPHFGHAAEVAAHAIRERFYE